MFLRVLNKILRLFSGEIFFLSCICKVKELCLVDWIWFLLCSKYKILNFDLNGVFDGFY